MEVNCGEHGGTHVLHALPTKPVAKVELCSIKQVERDMRLGCEAWLMLIQPATHVVATEADTCAEGDVVSGACNDATRWNSIVTEYSDVFEPPGMPAERDTVHRIELEPGSVPPYKRQYRVSAAELAEVRRQLDEYLEKGWIRPSCSPYGAPIVFIRKKTGELRMTVDYRALNRQTKKDVYPLPRIDDLLDKLSRAKFLSAIDLASGYH